jgi:hypothetical protein
MAMGNIPQGRVELIAQAAAMATARIYLTHFPLLFL